MDVRGDLDPPGSELDRDRPDPGRAATGLAQARGDRGAVGERRTRRQLEVEGGERRPRRDEDAAAGRMRHARAVVGGEIALAHPPSQLDVATAAKVGALAALRRARQLAVEEDRQSERAESIGDRAGEVDRTRPERLVVPDDRTDVDRADSRVGADLAGDVDQPYREVGEADERRQQ